MDGGGGDLAPIAQDAGGALANAPQGRIERNRVFTGGQLGRRVAQRLETLGQDDPEPHLVRLLMGEALEQPRGLGEAAVQKQLLRLAQALAEARRLGRPGLLSLQHAT